jgi:hypothetical protein
MNDDIRSALAAIVEGRTVKRSRHDLFWKENDLSNEFIRVLQAHGYTPTTVGEVPVHPGQRVPAFYLDGPTAFFGWVFWEKFTGSRQRKLFGSVVRNIKGDWEVQIPPSRHVVVYANTSLVIEMDSERPSSL